MARRENETPAQRDARLSAFERDAMPVKTTWGLRTVSDVDWQRDTSGLYVLINWRLPEDDVRIDVMTSDDTPLISFAGPTDGVRKHLMRWLVETGNMISIEHAAYIGHELCRADHLKTEYVQDATDNIETMETPAGPLSALKRIRDARDHSAEFGHYPDGTVGKGQQFDDWAADVASAVIEHSGPSEAGVIDREDWLASCDKADGLDDTGLDANGCDADGNRREYNA